MSVEQLIRSVDEDLKRFNAERADLSLRDKVLRLVEIFTGTRALSVAVVRADGCNANDGRERIRLYMVQHVGIPLSALELEVVSGISDYGRRIRELRVQDGYKILTGASNDPEADINLKPNQYLLLSPQPDREAARRWHLANRIRKQEGGSQSRILAYLRANLNAVVTSEELAYVARDASEFGRRTRELRTQEGYAVATRFTGRPDLKLGEYVLENLDRVAAPHDRHIPTDVQKAVYLRDHNTCCNCGWHRELWTRTDPRFLELHHLLAHVERGENVAENLLVLCSRCHDDVHAGRLAITPDMMGNPPTAFDQERQPLKL